MSALALLRANAPAWVEFLNAADTLHIKVQPTDSDGLRIKSYELLIQSYGDVVTVRENNLGQSLPEACPERHINPDGSFCLGLAVGSITSNNLATEWWSKLAKFLECQQKADKYGYWPPGLSLSHGDAAQQQLEMETLAANVDGLLEEVTHAISYKDNWLAGELPSERYNNRRGTGMFVNQLSPCPRGCKKSGKEVLRRNCPHKKIIFELVELEKKRRLNEAEVFSSLTKAGKKCCGSMKSCPLNDAHGCHIQEDE